MWPVIDLLAPAIQTSRCRIDQGQTAPCPKWHSLESADQLDKVDVNRTIEIGGNLPRRALVTGAFAVAVVALAYGIMLPLLPVMIGQARRTSPGTPLCSPGRSRLRR